MSIIKDIQPLIEQIKTATGPDEVIFYAVSFLTNENNSKELSNDDYVKVCKEIIETNSDAQLAAEMGRVLAKRGQFDFAKQLIVAKSDYKGDEWSFNQFDEISDEILKLINQNDTNLIISSNNMIGPENDWNAPEVEQWAGSYKGCDFILDRIYEDSYEENGQMYYNSFRWDWNELPDSHICDDILKITGKINDMDYKSKVTDKAN